LLILIISSGSRIAAERHICSGPEKTTGGSFELL
jgi:hypothetical protein